MGSRNVTAEQAREWLGIQPHSRIATSVVKRLAATVIALEADLAGLRIAHELYVTLLSLTRRERDEARARIAVLEEEQRRDLADVERFRSEARGYMDERDALRPGFESVVRLATWMSDNRSRAELGYDGCGMAGDEAIVVMLRLMVERDEAKALLDDAQEELHLTALAIHGHDADAHMLHEAAGELVDERDRYRAALDAIARAHRDTGACVPECSSWSEDYRINDCDCGYCEAGEDAGVFAVDVLDGTTNLDGAYRQAAADRAAGEVPRG